MTNKQRVRPGAIVSAAAVNVFFRYTKQFTAAKNETQFLISYHDKKNHSLFQHCFINGTIFTIVSTGISTSNDEAAEVVTPLGIGIFIAQVPNLYSVLKWSIVTS